MTFRYLGMACACFLVVALLHTAFYVPRKEQCSKQTNLRSCFHAPDNCAWCEATRVCAEWDGCLNTTYDPAFSKCTSSGGYSLVRERHRCRKLSWSPKTVATVLWINALFALLVFAAVMVGIATHIRKLYYDNLHGNHKNSSMKDWA